MLLNNDRECPDDDLALHFPECCELISGFKEALNLNLGVGLLAVGRFARSRRSPRTLIRRGGKLRRRRCLRLRITVGNDPLDFITREISTPFELLRDGSQRCHAIDQDMRCSLLGLVELLPDGGEQLRDVGKIIRGLDVDAAELTHTAACFDRAGEARGASDVGGCEHARADAGLPEHQSFGSSPSE